MSEETPTRPAHHMKVLAFLETVAEAAELYARLEVFAAEMCRAVGVRDAEVVIPVVQEKGRRVARRELSRMLYQEFNGVHEWLAATIEPDPIAEVFPGLKQKRTKSA
jgi:hypothetical protein